MEIILIILAVVIGLFIWKVVGKGAASAETAINKRIYADQHQSIGDLMSTTIAFDTSTDRERIVSSLFDIYPVERPTFELKTDWICNRATDEKGDDLLFAIGVRGFQYVQTANVPIAMAKLSFFSDGERTKAVFLFTTRSDWGSGTPTFSKQMPMLVAVIKDTFMELDSNCKISEAKQGDDR